jgi:Flp pilus assembly protein TadG
MSMLGRIAWLRDRLRRFRRDERGSNAVEFGLCAIPFFGLIFCFAESAYINYFTDVLQLAASQAARAVATGEAQSDTSTSNSVAATASQFAQNFICSNQGVGIQNDTANAGGTVGSVAKISAYLNPDGKCSNMIVDIRTAADFATASSDMKASFYSQPTKYCLGLPQQIMVMRVAYPLPAIFPLSLFSSAGTVTFNGSKVHIITATAAYENEPYENDGKNGNVVYTPPPGC